MEAKLKSLTSIFYLSFFIFFFINIAPAISASAHPIGIATQIPVAPISGIAESTYASTTLVPREITVSTTLTPGLFIAL